jgi:hypothetical protein
MGQSNPIPFDDALEPGVYHLEGFDCDVATETDEGCRWCQEKIDEVEA